MTNQPDIFLQTHAGNAAPESVSRLPGGPDDVLNHTTMSVPEKRALLASWASDAHAVPDAPSLRQLDDGSIVKVDDILRALKALDECEQQGRDTPRKLWHVPFTRRRGLDHRKWSWIRRSRRDDDDDPPPCPAYAAIPPKRGGGGTIAAAYAEPALA
jgi:hypothetical protein